jgi:hypothetical protein
VVVVFILGRCFCSMKSFDDLVRLAVSKAVQEFVERVIGPRTIPERNAHEREHHVLVVKLDSKDGTRYVIPVLIHFAPKKTNRGLSETEHVVFAHTIPQYPEHLEQAVGDVALLHHVVGLYRSENGKLHLSIPWGTPGRNAVERLIKAAALLKDSRNARIKVTDIPHPERSAFFVLSHTLQGLETPHGPLTHYTSGGGVLAIHYGFLHYYDYNNSKLHSSTVPDFSDLKDAVFYHPKQVVVVKRVAPRSHDVRIDRHGVRPRNRA